METATTLNWPTGHLGHLGSRPDPPRGRASIPARTTLIHGDATVDMTRRGMKTGPMGVFFLLGFFFFFWCLAPGQSSESSGWWGGATIKKKNTKRKENSNKNTCSKVFLFEYLETGCDTEFLATSHQVLLGPQFRESLSLVPPAGRCHLNSSKTGLRFILDLRDPFGSQLHEPNFQIFFFFFFLDHDTNRNSKNVLPFRHELHE